MASAWRCSIIVFVLCALLFASPIKANDDGDEEDSLTVAANGENDSDVVILTSDNFDQLTSKGSWLIEFFAPWCGHCKKLKPTWERVATKLDGKINVATVDCTMFKDLQDRFEVKSFPTLKFLRDGSSRMYKGERSEEALIKFGLDMMKPAVEDVETSKQVKEVIGNTPVSFLFIQGNDKKSGESAAKVFDKVAYQNQGVFKFMRARATDDNKLASKYSVTGASAVIALCDGGDDEKFTGAWSSDALSKWMDDRKLPLLSELDAANFEDVTGAGKIVIFAVTDPSSTAVTRHYLKEMLAVAKRYRQFVFANIDGVKFSKYVGQFGIQPDNLPSLFGLNYPRDEFYVGDEASLDKYQNANQISHFADDIQTGRIQARGTSAWYSPVGWYKSFEKYLNGLNETQLIMAVAGATLLLLAIIGAGCYYGAQDLAPEATATTGTATGTKGGKGSADSSAAIETKKTS